MMHSFFRTDIGGVWWLRVVRYAARIASSLCLRPVLQLTPLIAPFSNPHRVRAEPLRS